MSRTRHSLTSGVLLLFVSSVAVVMAKDRIFVDQWSPTRSELFIADADGRNPRKLLAGLQIDYNASFSFDGQWEVFTSERHGSADIFRVRANGLALERLTRCPCFIGWNAFHNHVFSFQFHRLLNSFRADDFA